MFTEKLAPWVAEIDCILADVNHDYIRACERVMGSPELRATWGVLVSEGRLQRDGDSIHIVDPPVVLVTE